METEEKSKNAAQIKQMLLDLNEKYKKFGLSTKEFKNACQVITQPKSRIFFSLFNISLLFIVLIISCLYEYGALQICFNYILGVRCIVPNNYFIWEATRPLSDCKFCLNLSQPIILPNLTREEFTPYAYSSQPIVLRKAFLHWPARKYFDFYFLKDLYERVEDSYRSVDDECQFLHFKSDFTSIRDVFSMSEARIKNEPGQKSWYVGWGNCHPQVLEEMRRYYPKPHFLPEDCEIPSKEYVFMGYDDGATMHLDYINRLMWQAQLRGSKTWYLVPPPECEDICSKLSFTVEPGDAVLLDTRVWYHGTAVASHDFSLSIQSEYG